VGNCCRSRMRLGQFWALSACSYHCRDKALDGNRDISRRCNRRFDSQHAPAIDHSAHRLDSIHDEIEHNCCS
jgi:hypothetical protein